MELAKGTLIIYALNQQHIQTMIGYSTVGIERGRGYSEMQFQPHDPRVTFTTNQCQFMSGICYNQKHGTRTY
jgi:hypothetical protein